MMDGEAVTVLQRAAGIMRNEFGELSAESISAFLFMMSHERVSIYQLAQSLVVQTEVANKAVLALSTHQNGAGLVNVDLDGDTYRVVELNEKGVNFAHKLGYMLRN